MLYSASLPEFDYKRPQNRKELLHLLSDDRVDTALLAGGTDLIPRVKLGLKTPELIIDVKEIEDLRYVEDRAGKIKIGSLTTIYDMKKSVIIKDKFPALHEAATLTASENLQLRGTLGGNIMQNTRCLYYNKPEAWRNSFNPCFKIGGDICHVARGGKQCFSVYCGDLVPALISIGATICFLRDDIEREIPIENIFTGDGKAPFSLGKNDFITKVSMSSAKQTGGYEKLRRRHAIDYPIVNTALSFHNNDRGRLVVGSVASKPLVYEFSSLKELYQVPQNIYKDASPVNNTSLPPIYRKQMAKILAAKLIRRIETG